MARWNEKEAQQLRAVSRQIVWESCRCDDALSRENCGGHVLRGVIRKGVVTCEPNYAGWARIYVEAGILIKPELLARELARTDNVLYVEALKRDLETFPQGER